MWMSAEVKVAENAGKLFQLLPNGSGDMKSWMMGAALAEGLVQRFRQAGGQDLYVVVGLGDIHIGGGPLGIATTRPGQHSEKVEQLIRDSIREFGGAGPRDAGAQIDVLRKGDVVLVGTKSTVARYAALKSSPRTDLIEPLATLIEGGAMAAGVFCPGSDYRRVSRELWPEFPGSLAPLRGELADRWLRFELSINPPPIRPAAALARGERC